MFYHHGQWRVAPPEEPPVHCPECGEELSIHDRIYTLDLSDCVVGCSCCLRAYNALEWFDAQCAP